MSDVSVVFFYCDYFMFVHRDDAGQMKVVCMFSLFRDLSRRYCVSPCDRYTPCKFTKYTSRQTACL